MKIHTSRGINAGSIFLPIFLILFGLVFILVPTTLMNENTNDWVETTGTITKLNHNKHITYVTYYVEPTLYEDRPGNYYDSRYTLQQKITIYYNPNNPEDFNIKVPNTFKIPFIVAGSIVCAIGLGIGIKSIIGGRTINKKIITNSENLNLEYLPSFMFEYVPLNANNVRYFTFTRKIDDPDFNDYEIKDDTNKVWFYTKCLKQSKVGNSTYQLIDDSNKKTTSISIRKSLIKSKNKDLNIMVDNLPIQSYFMKRHLTYSIEKNSTGYKYTIYNNGMKLADIYEENNNKGNFNIETANENIDDVALFVLCLTFR